MPDDDQRKKRVVQNGVARSDVIQSAHVAGNEDVFPLVLELHVPKGSIVADVTCNVQVGFCLLMVIVAGVFSNV